MLTLTGFGLGCLASLFMISWRDLRHLLVGKLFLLIIVAASAYLTDPLVPSGWRWITSDLQTALPLLFWLMCQLIFAPRPKLLSPWGAMALYSFLAPALSRPFIESGVWTGWAVYLGWNLGQWFEYIVVLHGVAHVIRHWRDDLVETRRTARLALLLILGSAVGVATISLNFGIYHDASRGLIVSLASLAILFCIATARPGLLELSAIAMPEGPPAQPGSFESHSQVPAPAAAQQARLSSTPTEDNDARQLQSLMQDGFFRQEKLTLAKLADALKIPEYRVRKVINQTLGYRNFNDYINQLRIAEARDRLVQTPEEPILNISLDVGYRTLSSFNRAFRDCTGTTPTAFREQKLANRSCANNEISLFNQPRSPT
ncbi:AraC family transcriptional regulator [Marinobacter fuscus]|uniref:AraC family transcriptional regulator n=1 Tax=Marinobacter fuscus TaxID=2109942 RepID=A0A2T1KAL9_9GAMM|nr:helix-turn-helix domain-containing protein [Marinobacter fuscus]PSF07165.1 AraC family transcriptional regulator [Marinobacter fuscus]